jgi:hypothetical protein
MNNPNEASYQEKTKEIIEFLSKCNPKDHAMIFRELRLHTKDRLLKDAEVRAVESKELQEFVKENCS